MIKVGSLVKILKKNNNKFFTGVPDSVLKKLSIYLQTKNKKQHIIASNEGAAVSIGIAGIFIETHEDPDNAPSDGPNMLNLKDLKELVLKLKDFDNLAKS